MKPSSDQVERAETALYPFVTHWRLPLNPEDLEELAVAVLTHFDSPQSLDAIHAAAESQVEEHAAWARRGNEAYAEGARKVDGFSLQCLPKILARLDVQATDAPQFICSFEPTPYFDEFHDLFEKQRQAIVAGDAALIDDAARAIEAAGISLWRFSDAGPSFDFVVDINDSTASVRYRADPGFAQLDEDAHSTARSIVLRSVVPNLPDETYETPLPLLTRLASVASAYDLLEASTLGTRADRLGRNRSRELRRELVVLQKVSSDPLLKERITRLRDLANRTAGGGKAAELFVGDASI